MRARAMPGEDPADVPHPSEVAAAIVQLASPELTETGKLFVVREGKFWITASRNRLWSRRSLRYFWRLRETLDRETPARHKARHENNDLHLLLNNFAGSPPARSFSSPRKVQQTNGPARQLTAFRERPHVLAPETPQHPDTRKDGICADRRRQCAHVCLRTNGLRFRPYRQCAPGHRFRCSLPAAAPSMAKAM